MSSFLGEEFIRVRPDASTFRAELQAQIATAMTGVQGQLAQAQAQLRSTAAAAGTTTPSGIVLPPGVRAATVQAGQAAAAQAQATRQVGAAAKATNTQLQALSSTQRKVAGTGRDMERNITSAEQAAGRYTRGLLAATAASTGFFRAVSFASGAFLVGATIGASIAAAVNEFTEMTAVAAQTTQLIKSTGGAAGVTAKQVDALSRSVLGLTGVDDELVKQGANVLLTFRAIRNEAGQGNDVFNRAVKAAADISSVFRTDLRGSAVQLGKALQDPVRGVTALRRSGISLSQGQRDLIKQLVASGAILTAQKLILGEVERQVGRTAEAIGRTLPGRLRIMREEALNSLGDLVDRLSKSETAANAVAGAAQGFAQAWGVVRSVLQTVGPVLLGIGQGLGLVTQALGGVGVLIGAAVAYKAVTAAAAAAAGAQRVYAVASAGAAQAALAQAQASGTATVALEEQAAAEITAARGAQRSLTVMTALAGVFALGAAASGQWVLALGAGGIAVLGIATKARAAVIALREAGAAVTAFSVASAALGGPLGIAAIAAGALAIGLFKVIQSTKNSAGSLNQAKEALDGLNESLDAQLRLRAALGTARERFGVAQFDVRGAERDLQRAQERLSSTRAQPGSLKFRFLEDQVRVAEQNLANVTEDLTRAQQELDAAREKARINEQAQPARLAKITQALQDNIGLLQRVAAGPGQDPTGTEQRIQALTASLTGLGLAQDEARKKAEQIVATQARVGPASQAIQQVIDRYQKLGEAERAAAEKAADAGDSAAAAGHKASAAAAEAIFVLTSRFQRLPTKKEIEVIVRTSEQGADVNKILQQLGVLSTADIQLHLEAPQLRGVNATLREQFLIAQGILKAERDKLATIEKEAFKRREVLRAARLEVAAARDAVTSAREAQVAAQESFADAQRGLALARRGLVDAIRDSARAVSDARRTLREARENFADTITQTLQGVSSAQRALLEAQQNLADVIREQTRSVREARQALAETIRESGIAVAEAITSARDATNQAIQDAKGNLLELNRSLADSIAKFLEKTGGATVEASARMLALRQRIIRGGGGPETIRAAQEVQFTAQGAQPEVDADAIKRKFDDLTDAFTRGQISLKEYNRLFALLVGDIDKFKPPDPKRFVLPNPTGLVKPGNLDLLHRKIAKVGNAIATVRSITVGFNRDGKNVFTLLPTIIDGKALTGTVDQIAAKAIAHFKRTGENLGTFASEATADAYAKRLHDQQANFFLAGTEGASKFGAGFAQGIGQIDIGKFRDIFGSEATNELLDTLRASHQQAVLLQEGPKKIGGAIAQELISPLRVVGRGEKAIADARVQAARDIKASKVALADAIRTSGRSIGNAVQGVRDAQVTLTTAVKEGAKSISKAQQGIGDAQVALADAIRQQTRNISDAHDNIADATRGVTRAEREIVRANRQLAAAERRLRQAQHKETIANTRALKQNAKETRQLKEVIKARRALIEVKPKPTGAAAEESNLVRNAAPR